SLQIADGAGGRVDIRWSQLGAQQMLPTKDIERQIAITTIVSMKESACLVAVQRIVGGIDVEHDFLRRCGGKLEERFHKPVFDLRLPGHNLFVATVLA